MSLVIGDGLRRAGQAGTATSANLDIKVPQGGWEEIEIIDQEKTKKGNVVVVRFKPNDGHNVNVSAQEHIDRIGFDLEHLALELSNSPIVRFDFNNVSYFNGKAAKKLLILDQALSGHERPSLTESNIEIINLSRGIETFSTLGVDEKFNISYKS